jgi:hypothetical protein
MKNMVKIWHFMIPSILIFLFAFIIESAFASETAGDLDKYKNEIYILKEKVQKQEQKISTLTNFYNDQSLMSKKSLEDKLNLMKQEGKIIEKLATTVNIVVLFISAVVLIATFLSLVGYISLKKSFEDKMDNLQTIIESRARKIADRDLTSFIEKMYSRDVAVLNQRRESFIRAEQTSEFSVSQLIDVFENIEIFSLNVNRLFIHPDMPLAEEEILRSLYYFNNYPSLYITDCLQNIRFSWDNNTRVSTMIDSVISACEELRQS